MKEYKYEKLKIPSSIDLNKVWNDAIDRNIIEDHNDFLDVMRYAYNDIGITRTTYKAIEFDKKPKIKNVIFNDPATIVYWTDGTRTVVKCEDVTFDPEKGLAMAISKKVLGTSESQGNYYNEFKKWLPKEEDESTTSTLLKALGDVMYASWSLRSKKED